MVIGQSASDPVKGSVNRIVGDRNTLLKAKVPHRYNVMDFFRITHVWWESFAGKSGAKLRMEKIDISSKSWWAAKGSPSPLPLHKRNCATEPKKEKCSSCEHTSPQVYRHGWMCLRPGCSKAWTLNGLVPPAELEFDADFLAFRTPSACGDGLCKKLIRSFSSFIEDYSEDNTYSRSSWKGIVCPSCSKCVSRIHWGGWKCTDDIAYPRKGSEKVCAFEHMIAMRPVPLESVVGDATRTPLRAAPGVRVTIESSSDCPYEIRKYTLPNGVGSITHFIATAASNSRPNGPNDMFQQMQLGEFGLRRYQLQQSVGK